MGGKKKYINIFGSFTELFSYKMFLIVRWKWRLLPRCTKNIVVCFRAWSVITG